MITTPPIPEPAREAPEWGRAYHRSVVTALQRLVQAINSEFGSPDAPETSLSMNNKRITNLSDPAAQRDAINLQYLDKRLAGLSGGRGDALTVVSTATTTIPATIQIAY